MTSGFDPGFDRNTITCFPQNCFVLVPDVLFRVTIWSMRLLVAAGLVLILPLAACQSGSAPAVSPSPVVSPSSVDTGPPESEAERQARLDKEAAASAYMRSSQEVSRLAMAGGAKKPTKILLETTSGNYLKIHMETLKDLHQSRWRIDRPLQVTVKQVPGTRGDEIDLIGCEDASKIRLLDRQGKEVIIKDRAHFVVQSLTATRTNGVWKITDTHSDPLRAFPKDGPCAR